MQQGSVAPKARFRNALVVGTFAFDTEPFVSALIKVLALQLGSVALSGCIR